MGVFCNRCNRHFRTTNAHQQHRRDSQHHNICAVCSADYGTWQDLLDHYRVTDHMWACQDCGDRMGMAYEPNSSEWYAHLEEFNACGACEEHFDSEFELAMHKGLIHDDSSSDDSSTKNTECGGCGKDFRSVSGMIMHLESGGCPAEVDIYDVNRWAARCPEWRDYLDSNARSRMKHRYHTWRDFPYSCLYCDARFERVSALIQHAEQATCSLDVDGFVVQNILTYIASRWE